jgi:hypothetical protein
VANGGNVVGAAESESLLNLRMQSVEIRAKNGLVN